MAGAIGGGRGMTARGPTSDALADVAWDRPIRLRPDAVRVVRPSSTLFVDEDGHALRVSPQVSALWPLLRDGITPAALTAHLRARHPQAARVEEQVLALVASLRGSALLAGAPPAAPPPTRVTAVVDRVATIAARAIARLGVPVAASLIVFAVAAALVSNVIQLTGSPPRLAPLLGASSWLGAAFVLLVAVPLHELGHAIAARSVGLRIAEVGLTVRGLPRPFVRIPGSIAAPARHRVVIAAAGPLVDLAVAGFAAAIARGTGSGAASVVFVWTLLGALAATSPLVSGDGARLLEGALDDDLVRRAALGGRGRLTSRRAIRIYRLAIVAHVATTVLVLGALLR